MSLLARMVGTPLKRLVILAGLDTLLFTFTLAMSFVVRIDELPKRWMLQILIVMLVIRIPLLILTRSYSASLEFTGLRDLVRILGVVMLSSLVGVAAVWVGRGQEWAIGRVPYGVIAIDWAFACVAISASRLSLRILGLLTSGSKPGKRTLVIGAGGAAEQIIRSMFATKDFDSTPVALLDDDPGKLATTIHGVRVLGTTSDISRVVKELDISTVIIAIPSAPTRLIRRWFDVSRGAGVAEVLVLPHISEILNGQVSVRDIRRVSLHDLLGREVVQVDPAATLQLIVGKSILITGAAGSIGSETCRQVSKLKPSALIMLDQDETGLFHIEQELKAAYPALRLVPIIADVTNATRIRELFSQFRPFVVFHAAAYKHVPMMEGSPEEAVRNNVLGTAIVARAAEEAEVERFVFISTDKAVEPVSVMGKTKRVGELVVSELGRTKRTRFMSVRFGNVMGSRGSVIESFQKQIETGGPVTVTHPDMERFFMLISEAVMLVLQAATMGEGGEILILDMGPPIRILDLAHEMIRLAGMEPDKDLEVKITGIRPGERLSEKLHYEDEILSPTRHPKISVARVARTLIGPSVLEVVDSYSAGKLRWTPNELLDNLLSMNVGSSLPSKTR